ncbi:MAG TPA: nuclear transport factor 2 family protein [Candidatus Melainabacteria bacterium]|nr:nuclear transport factor 2 family protein [Candidatus Melainabacteria bacterium]
MSNVEYEIAELEEQLRQADLKPNQNFFQNHLDDQMVLMVDGDICSHSPKAYIVDKHHPAKAQRFDRVEITEMKILEQGDTAVVTGFANYEGPDGRFSMNFMRIWVKKEDGWKIVAGSMTHLDEARTVPASSRVTAEITIH